MRTILTRNRVVVFTMLILSNCGLMSCVEAKKGNKNSEDGVVFGSNKSKESTSDREEEKISTIYFLEKKSSNVNFSVNLLSGDEFYQISNHGLISKEKKLGEESVIVLEVFKKNNSASIWNDKTLQLDKLSTEQYLTGPILKDFSVGIGDKLFLPIGVHYEHGLGSASKIRLYVFLGKVQKTEVKHFVYYDKLFGAGMLRFQFKN